MRLKIKENDQIYFVKFSKATLTFGRSRSADVKLNCAHTSGLHCAMEFDPSIGLFVEDLGSMNGTFVDEKQINAKTQIYLLNKIRIGEVVVEIDSEKLSSREQELLSPKAIE